MDVKKRLAALVLALSVLTTSAITAFATESEEGVTIDGTFYSFTEISERTGLPEEGLEKYYQDSPAAFEQDLRETLNPVEVPGRYFASPRATLTIPSLVQQGRNGDILISGTNHTGIKDIVDIRHGHAAIVVDVDYQKIVHAPGPKYKSVAEYCTAMTSASQSQMRIRLYKVSTASTSVAQQAADYAYDNLRGLTYDFDSGPRASTVNCGTLVWKAYDHVNIDLKWYYYTVTPQSIVEDTKTKMVGNINWRGNENSFAILDI